MGGSAIEIYTLGRYASGDIDIVTDKRQRIAKVLEAWGFQKPSRIWLSEEFGLVVDLVKHPYTGRASLTTLMLVIQVRSALQKLPRGQESS